MSDEMERQTRRFLDGELDADEEREVLHLLAEDEEARSLLRLDLGLRRTIAENPPFPAPRDFTHRVMSELEAREEAGARDRSGRLAALWSELRRPRTMEWRPAHALLAAAAVILLVSTVVFAGGITASSQPLVTLAGTDEESVPARREAASESRLGASRQAEPDTVFVRFALEAESAGSVAVAGDFSGWDPVPLHRTSRDGQTVWSGLVAVPRGEHRYMFVIDGSSWVTDPLASAYWDDGFGNRNAILSL